MVNKKTKCFIFHDWNKWKIVECEIAGLFIKGTETSVQQMRTCDTCGKTQVESLYD